MKTIHKKRPISITIISVILALSILGVVSIVTDTSSEIYSSVIGTKKIPLHSSIVLVSTQIILILLFGSFVGIQAYGLWILKKWGMYLFSASMGVQLIFGIIDFDIVDIIIRTTSLFFVWKNRDSFT